MINNIGKGENLLNGLEQVETENKKIASDMGQLAETEESRLSVITAIYVKLNNEMRLQNIQDIKKDISYGAKDFGQLPEKYTASMESIIRSYIQEINQFMKVYNDAFINIQNILKSAEERQKYYFFKIRETVVMRQICILAEKQPEEYAVLDNQIKEYRKKLGIYEKIIMMCDKEFENCKNQREQDFKELFEIKQEQALAVIQKRTIFHKIWNKIKNTWHGYENFSKFVLQKHAAKINRLKTETLSAYITKIRQNTNSFTGEVQVVLENS